jgi:foldase protein PrsA
LSRSVRIFSALSALFACSLAIAACGSGVPGDSVVRVDDTLIKKSTFDHWLGIAAQSSAQPGAAVKPVAPDSPNFTKCIAAKRKATATQAKGTPKVTDAQLKTQCKTEYEGLRDQVLQFLIQAAWIKGEAKDLKVKATPKEIQASFLQQKKQSFPTDKEFQAFLKSSGYTIKDIDLRVEVDLLSNKIRTKVTKGQDKATPAQISAYYTKNKTRFTQPERRDVSVVLAKTQAKAAQALAALKGRQSFAAVAKKFSVDPTSKAQGGKLLGVTPGQQERAFDTAIFKAAKGTVTGPVKTSFGFYVFRVDTITPTTTQTLQQAQATIKQLLASQNQQKALDAFVKKFTKKWTGKTNCRDGFQIKACKNAPSSKRTSTVPPGAVPQTGSTTGQNGATGTSSGAATPVPVTPSTGQPTN